jgi:hypothetical protein
VGTVAILLLPSANPGYRETAEKIGWEMDVGIEKIIATVLNEAHKRQVEAVMETLSEGPEEFYKSYLDWELWTLRSPGPLLPMSYNYVL